MVPWSWASGTTTSWGIEDGGVDGLALDGHVLSLGDAFTVTGCDDPVSVENGVIEVLDLDTLDDAELQEIVGQIDTLLGDLLGEGGATC